jgi:hypothetical protein
MNVDAATRSGRETARELCRRRALEIVTRRFYFDLRSRMLEALDEGRIGLGDLLLAGDEDLLRRVQPTSEDEHGDRQ